MKALKLMTCILSIVLVMGFTSKKTEAQSLNVDSQSWNIYEGGLIAPVVNNSYKIFQNIYTAYGCCKNITIQNNSSATEELNLSKIVSNNNKHISDTMYIDFKVRPNNVEDLQKFVASGGWYNDEDGWVYFSLDSMDSIQNLKINPNSSIKAQICIYDMDENSNIPLWNSSDFEQVINVSNM